MSRDSKCPGGLTRGETHDVVIAQYALSGQPFDGIDWHTWTNEQLEILHTLATHFAVAMVEAGRRDPQTPAIHIVIGETLRECVERYGDEYGQ